MSHQTCLATDRLSDFNAGKLGLEEFEEISLHLESCAACQKVLEKLGPGGDALVDELRHPRGQDYSTESGCFRAMALAANAGLIRDSTRDDSAGHTKEQLAANLGKYRLLECIGQGGMGTVYKAVHTLLKKTVAIKLLSSDRLQKADAVARFRREIEAAGRLDHPHIVHASDADQADGRHFLVMEWLDGQDLAKRVRTQGPLPVAEACDFIRQAALGLECAHQHGLVHRDVKPSNLMLTTVDNRPVVKVLDLGLALLRDDVQPGQEEDLTAAGQIMGTYDYMAPEQSLRAHTVDARADIYSLGCTFYFLLTGKAPFAGRPETRKLLAHELEKPVPVNEVNPAVAPPINALLEKMMAKNPGQRPQSMAEVAEELTVLLKPLDQTILGKPLSETKWYALSLGDRPPALQKRRSILLATGALGAVVALVVGIIVIVRDQHGKEIARLNVPDGGSVEIQNNKNKRPLKKLIKSQTEGKTRIKPKAVDLKTEAEKRIEVARHLAGARQAQSKQLHEVVIAECTEALRLEPKNFDALHMRAVHFGVFGKWRSMEEDLEAALHLKPNHIDAHFLLGYLYLNTGRNELSIDVNTDVIRQNKNIYNAYVNRGAAYVNLGQFELAMPDVSKALQLIPSQADKWFWRAELNKTLGHNKQAQEDLAKAIELDPKFAKEKLTSLPLPPMQRYAGHENRLAWKIAFSAKGDRLYSCGGDHRVRSWEVATGKEGVSYKGHTGEVLAMALSPDGQWLVSGSRDGTARVWDLKTGKELRKLQDRRDECWGLAFASDSRRVVGDGGDGGTGAARIWDVRTGEPRVTAQNNATVCAFHPNGRQFLGGTSAGLLRIFDAATGKAVRNLVGHNYWIRKVAISPDGKLAASVSSFTPLGPANPKDETFAILWDWSSGKKKFRLSHTKLVFGLAFSPDSKRLATGAFDKTIRIWDVGSGKEVWKVTVFSEVMDLAYSPSGRELAAACKDGMIRLWRLPPEVATK